MSILGSSVGFWGIRVSPGKKSGEGLGLRSEHSASELTESSTFYLNLHTRKQQNCRLKTCLDLWPAEFLGSAAGGLGISGLRRTFVVLFWFRSWSSCEFGASGLAGELL